jgi:hypothetical protein
MIGAWGRPGKLKRPNTGPSPHFAAPVLRSHPGRLREEDQHMNRLRLATWTAVAGLGLIAGCQSCPTDCCNTCCSGGLLSRLGLRRTSISGSVIYDGPAGGISAGSPVIPPAMGGDCPCSLGGAGPILGSPAPYMGGSAPFMTIPGSAVPPMNTFVPPMNTLPPPMPGATPPLAPVPNGSAPATPAPPSPTSRRG